MARDERHDVAENGARDGRRCDDARYDGSPRLSSFPISIMGSPGTRYCPVAHAPRSPVLQRSEQKGRYFDCGVHSTAFLQTGQLTMRGFMIKGVKAMRSKAER
jgi:hypothetical protein